MGVPFVLQQALVGVDITEGGWVGWAGGVGAVFRIAATGVLRPEAVEDECRMRGALNGVGMRVAELRRPREIEQVVVETGTCGCAWGGVI